MAELSLLGDTVSTVVGVRATVNRTRSSGSTPEVIFLYFLPWSWVKPVKRNKRARVLVDVLNDVVRRWVVLKHSLAAIYEHSLH